MNMKKTYTASVNETVWEGRLPNGLRIYVSTKPGFARSYAVFATRYGGADRRFQLHGEWLDTPAGIAHFLEHKMFDMPDGTSALTTLSEADQIIVLQNGRVAQQGSHEELIRQDGLYRRIYLIQTALEEELNETEQSA